MTIVDCRPAPPKRTPKRHKRHTDKKAIAAQIDGVTDPSARRQLIRALAAAHNVGESTIYEWWLKERQGTLKPRARTAVDPDFLEHALRCLYAKKGDVTATHALLVDEGRYARGVRSLQDLFHREVDRMIRLSAALDEDAARLLTTYISYTCPHRDYEWQLDLVDLCVEVELADGTTEHLWCVAAVCVRTGVTRGWCLTIGVPTADAVAQAILMGIRPRTETFVDADGNERTVRVGGAPKILRLDNGLQNLAAIVVMLLAEAGTTMQAAQEYNHTAQGKIERWNKEAKRLTAPLFGSTRGTKTIRDEEPFRPAVPVMEAETVERIMAEHIHAEDRRPRRGQKLSPLELYALEDEAETPYVGRVLDDETLAQFRLREVPGRLPGGMFRVERGCVRYRNTRWTAEPMAELRGDTVELWQSLVDPDYVEVRAEGHRFRVVPWDELEPDAQEQILQGRGERVGDSNRLRREGARLAADAAEEAQAETDLAEVARDEAAADAPDAGDDLEGQVGSVDTAAGVPSSDATDGAPDDVTDAEGSGSAAVDQLAARLNGRYRETP